MAARLTAGRMERSSDGASNSFIATSTTGFREVKERDSELAVRWVPDEEVNECPVCHRRFHNVSLRKHHCRICGRVVCGGCSDNQLFLQNMGSKQRVCDPCFDLRRHDRAEALTENQGNNRQVEASLKANLKEKHQQSEWFRSFLMQVAAEADAGCGGSDESAGEAAEVQEEEGEELAAREVQVPSSGSSAPPEVSARDAELEALKARARRKWGQVRRELRMNMEEMDELERHCEELEDESRQRADAAQKLRQAVASMEADLSGQALIEDERDQLTQRTEELQRELEGLTQRIASLEADTRQTQSSSLLSSSSILSASGSFIGEPAQRCTERCRLAECALM